MSTETAVLTEDTIQAMINRSIEASKNKKETPSVKAIRKLLLDLPEQTERDFELTVCNNYAVKWHDDFFYIKEKINGVEKKKKGLLFDFIDLIKKEAPSEEERKLAFHAFCVAENYERRNDNLTQMGNVYKEYSPYFQEHPFLLHMEVCAEIKSLEAYKKEDWERKNFSEILEKARINKEQLTGNIGAAHAYAEFILLAFENDPTLLNYLNENKKEKLLQSAVDTMVVVTSINDYAKFFCTYGRLLAVSGKYSEALEKLNTAIDKEDNSSSNYPVRVGRYLTFIQQVRAQQQAEVNKQAADEQLKNVVQKMEDQTKDSTTKSMEFLGLFSGIVSFTIGSISISGEIEKFSASQVAGLIIVLMGALMGVFAGFGIILHGMDMRKAGSRKGLRNLIVLLLGIAIAAGGRLICSR